MASTATDLRAIRRSVGRHGAILGAMIPFPRPTSMSNAGGGVCERSPITGSGRTHPSHVRPLMHDAPPPPLDRQGIGRFPLLVPLGANILLNDAARGRLRDSRDILCATAQAVPIWRRSIKGSLGCGRRPGLAEGGR